MGPVARKLTDVVTQNIDIAERIRKLEVMQQSYTVVPKRWEATDDELDTLARAVTGIGPWQQDNPVGTLTEGRPAGFPFTFQTRASYALLQGMKHQGVAGEGPTFTNFYSQLGVIAPPGWSPIAMVKPNEGTPPNLTTGIGGDENGNWDLWEERPHYRRCVWTGIPAGYPWTFHAPGTTFVIGGTGVPNYGGARNEAIGRWLTLPGAYVSHEAAQAGMAGDPYNYVKVDTCKWIGANWDGVHTDDCENTPAMLEARYNLEHGQPGEPFGPDIFDQYCHKFGSQYVIGGQSGVYHVLPPADLMLLNAPGPYTGHEGSFSEATGGNSKPSVVWRDDYECETYAIRMYSYPGFQALRDRLQQIAAPGAIMQQLQIALGRYDSKWQWIHLNGNYTGKIEGTVRDKHVFLRGTVRNPARWQNSGALGGFLESQLPGPILPPGGDYVLLNAHIPGKKGGPVGVLFQRQGDLWMIGPARNQDFSDDANRGPHAICFDGVRWPTDKAIPD